jgi:hypothetical protein
MGGGGGGIPNWILATYGLPEPPPQGRCTSSSSSIVDEHQRKKVSVCVCANNKCRTAPHHMAPKSFDYYAIMDAWSVPKVSKRVVVWFAVLFFCLKAMIINTL